MFKFLPALALAVALAPLAANADWVSPPPKARSTTGVQAPLSTLSGVHNAQRLSIREQLSKSSYYPQSTQFNDDWTAPLKMDRE